MSGTIVETLPGELKLLESAVDDLAQALKQTRIFPPGYPSIMKSVAKAWQSLRELIGHKESLQLRVVRDSICLLNFEISLASGEDRARSALLRALRKMAAGEIRFSPDLSQDELLAFLEIASSAISEDRKFDFNGAWTRIRNIAIKHGTHSMDDRSKEAEEKIYPLVETSTPGTGHHPDWYVESFEQVASESRIGREVETVLDKLEKIQSLEGKTAGRSILRMIEGGGANEKIVLFLKSLRNYDDYTFAHSVNVAVISTATARHIGFDEAAAGRVGLAALLHDIGKIYVPRQIIRKKGRLSPSEWQIIRKHPVDGARILQDENLEEDLWRVAYEHHMQFDLSGYPNVKEGSTLFDASHIVRIADTYDALTTKRAYRKQISPYEAIKLMSKTRGSEFHPGYFDIFMHMMGNIPIGSTLELETGETVLVVDIKGRNGLLPRVKLLRLSDGSPVNDGRIIDLNEVDTRTRKKRYKISKIENSPVRDVDIGKYLVRS